MDTKVPLDKSEEEKFNEDFLKIAFPDWMRSSKESNNFRGFVVDKHTIVENLLDLLITASFFERMNGEKPELFRDNVLTKMDFAKKVMIVYDMGLIDNVIKSKIFRVNDYRKAQAHIKKDDPLREPSKNNWDIFQQISTDIHSKLSSKIMLTDADLRNRVAKIIEQNSQDINK
ncbi:MAG: hypothetical protein ACD_61C00010G0001 [uncultured bacterium]|nr:MAG: hypothetical protein ACD_61C00010G0001 [uncultured bacterium]